MALSMDSVYQTLNNFFSAQFNIGLGEGGFKLRFGQSRSQITGSDYSTPNRATENFSHLVNQIPIEKGDGMTIFFSGLNQIDEFYYYQMVTPATVLNPDDGTAFGSIKEQADTTFTNIKEASGSGLLGEKFSPSRATPSDWYNVASGNWTNQSLSVTDPTKPAPNNIITLSFDYAKVTISRPWYFEPFIADKTWYIHEKYEGQLTSFDKVSANLIDIPVGFIAIKNLVINGTWSADELNTFKTAFGPFLISSGAGSKLEYDDIQVIGWMLEKVPELPPLNDDSLPPQVYSLIDNAASATWTSFINQQPNQPPNGYNPFVWQQPPMNTGGSAAIDNDVMLEDGNTYKALRTFTYAGPSGSIKGFFPPFTLNGKGTFSAEIGFAANSTQQTANSILFQVIIFTPDNPANPPKIVFSQMKNFTETLIRVSVDLSSFQNKQIGICLFVENAAPPSIGATAYWVNPVVNY
jgi:hypothetical protein